MLKNNLLFVFNISIYSLIIEKLPHVSKNYTTIVKTEIVFYYLSLHRKIVHKNSQIKPPYPQPLATQLLGQVGRKSPGHGLSVGLAERITAHHF